MNRPRVPQLHLVGPPEGVDADAYRALVMGMTRTANAAVHVRMPGATAGDVLALAARLRAEAGLARLIVNDRVDVAQLVRADGVHLGERGLPVSAARQLLGPAGLIGRSIHDVEGARAAERHGADYLIAGHVFPTTSKPGVPGRGLSWLRDVIEAVVVPVIAIGGITSDSLRVVLDVGTWGVAVSSALAMPDATERLAAMLEHIEQQTGRERHDDDKRNDGPGAVERRDS